MKTSYLEIFTWAGSSVVWFAKHYYGKIWFGDKNIDVEYVLIKKDTTKLNIDSREDFFPGSKYKIGETTSRFLDKERLIKEAIKLFKKDSYEYDVLLEGDHCTCDPQKMLIGPDGISEKANLIWEQFESYDGWNCQKSEEQEVRKICDRWDEIVGKHWERD